jgi:hypothetical protein
MRLSEFSKNRQFLVFVNLSESENRQRSLMVGASQVMNPKNRPDNCPGSVNPVSNNSPCG